MTVDMMIAICEECGWRGDRLEAYEAEAEAQAHDSDQHEGVKKTILISDSATYQ